MRKYIINILLGYDVMLDSTFKPHLLEVNAQPSIYNELLDRSVNEPMVQEMFRVVGYHIPRNAAMGENLNRLSQIFNVSPKKVKNMLFESRFYNKTLNEEDRQKQSIFNRKGDREWLEHITDEFTPADIRTIIKYEEEYSACKEFDRIFPTSETHKYFSYFKDISYYDKLVDGVEYLSMKNYGNRNVVIKKVKCYCRYYYRCGDASLPSHEECMMEISKLGTNGEGRESIFSSSSITDFMKRLDEMGGFATLRKPKTMTCGN